MKIDMPRFILAGTGSGSGKTLLTCALLLAFKKKNYKPASFKCGPDYLDPLFHTQVLGIASSNLDLFLCGEKAVKYLMAENFKANDLAIIEGVMGLYDGLGGGDEYSTNHLARSTKTPTVLVVNTRGMALSLGAILYGFKNFRPNTIKGVIFNQCSEKTYPMYKEIVEKELGLRVFGFLPTMPEAKIASRKLGLEMPTKFCELKNNLDKVADQALKSIDMESLGELARSAITLECSNIKFNKIAKLKIAVAQDSIFCFHYQDNFKLLEKMGAELEFFSPAQDSSLPKGACGLILGGGYIEDNAQSLAKNTPMMQAIKEVHAKGLPIIAEGGAYIYLCKSYKNLLGEEFPMLGLVETKSYESPSLKRFGYSTLKAQGDSFLCSKGAEIRVHEFHYSDSEDNGAFFKACKANGDSWLSTHVQGNLLAGFPYFHLWGSPFIAEAFIKSCASYKNKV